MSERGDEGGGAATAAAAAGGPGGAGGRPVVRLRAGADARAIRHGFPWVYADEIVADRRTRALAAGSLAVLEDAERRPLGLVTVNPGSRIAARVLDPDPAAAITPAWLAGRLTRALALRERLYPEPFYRLVHAEADGLPGVVIDRFGAAAVIQPNAAWAERHLGALADALVAVTGVTTVVKCGSGRMRAAEGLGEETAVVAGGIEGPVAVAMNGATHFADLLGGQKTGFYYDQRDNQALAASLARGLDVLDVFAHSGGFALAALARGAASALAVDGSAAALALAVRGAAATGVAARLAVERGDAFRAMAALAETGRRFGLVVCDPPAFAPAREALDAGLRAYERVARLAAGLVAPGGFLVLCSCSHAADLAAFRAASGRGIGRAGRRAQILATGFAGPDHPVLPQLAEQGYLKALFFRLDG